MASSEVRYHNLHAKVHELGARLGLEARAEIQKPSPSRPPLLLRRKCPALSVFLQPLVLCNLALISSLLNKA